MDEGDNWEQDDESLRFRLKASKDRDEGVDEVQDEVVDEAVNVDVAVDVDVVVDVDVEALADVAEVALQLSVNSQQLELDEKLAE